jgi:hypothetical protein
VLEDGKVAGRIFFLAAAGPQDRPWMGRAGTREETMAAFAEIGDANNFVRVRPDRRALEDQRSYWL